MEGELDWSHFT